MVRERTLQEGDYVRVGPAVYFGLRRYSGPATFIQYMGEGGAWGWVWTRVGCRIVRMSRVVKTPAEEAFRRLGNGDKI
jgi:hypothetical protein